MKSNLKELQRKANSMVRETYDENINILQNNSNRFTVKSSKQTMNFKEKAKVFSIVFGTLIITLLIMIYVLFNGYPPDYIVIPMTIVLIVLSVLNAYKSIKEEINETNS